MEIPAAILKNKDSDDWCVDLIVKTSQIVEKSMLHVPKPITSSLFLVFDGIVYFVDAKAGFALQGSPGANFEVNLMPIIIRKRISSPSSNITYNKWTKEYKGMYWKDTNNVTYFDRAWTKSRYEINAALRDYESMDDVPESEVEFIKQVDAEYWSTVIDTTNLIDATRAYLEKNPITDRKSRQAYYDWSNKLLKGTFRVACTLLFFKFMCNCFHRVGITMSSKTSRWECSTYGYFA